MKKKLSFFMSILTVFFIATNIAYANSGQLWSDAHLDFNDWAIYGIKACLVNKGLSPVNVYNNSTYTKNDILNKVWMPHVFYMFAHGGNISGGHSGALVQAANKEFVYASEIAQKTLGHYNIVYFASCHVGETAEMANAFGISASENEAFLGFNDVIYQSVFQAAFDRSFFQNLGYGQNFNTSVWNARSGSGITNYHMYGNIFATLEK